MPNEEKYNIENMLTIGQAADRGNISRRTLRYYEKLGILKPDFVDTNGYRYYTHETTLRIPIIKYLKIMDFTLDEIKDQLSNPKYKDMIRSFDGMIGRCDEQIDELTLRKTIIKDWKELLEEACLILSMKLQTINIKYMDRMELIKYPIRFKYDYSATILDLGFANFVEKEDNKISGPVMLYFPSMKERLEKGKNNKPVDGLYIQKALKEPDEGKKHILKSGMYVSKYHIGSHFDILKSYEEILEWEKKSEYKIKGPIIERFVADYWSTYDEDKYVTELIAPITLREERR